MLQYAIRTILLIVISIRPAGTRSFSMVSAIFRHSLFRFLLVGISNTAIGMGIVYISWRFLGWPDVPANAFGYLIGFLWSYGMNRVWTFNDRGAVGRSFARFAGVCALAYAANLLVMLGARNVMGDASFMPHIFGAVTYTGLGYLGSRFFAFRRPPHAGDAGPIRRS